MDFSGYWNKKFVPNEFLINKTEQQRIDTLSKICEQNIENPVVLTGHKKLSSQKITPTKELPISLFSPSNTAFHHSTTPTTPLTPTLHSQDNLGPNTPTTPTKRRHSGPINHSQSGNFNSFCSFFQKMLLVHILFHLIACDLSFITCFLLNIYL